MPSSDRLCSGRPSARLLVVIVNEALITQYNRQEPRNLNQTRCFLIYSFLRMSFFSYLTVTDCSFHS